MTHQNQTPLQPLSKTVAGLTSLPDALARLERGEIVEIDAGEGTFEIMATGPYVRFLYLPKNKPGQAYYTRAMKSEVRSDLPGGKVNLVEDEATAFTISVVMDQLQLVFTPPENRAKPAKSIGNSIAEKKKELSQESTPRSASKTKLG